MRTRWILGLPLALSWALGASPTWALELTLVGWGALGLDQGFACPDAAASCAASATFSLDASAEVVGGLTITGALFDGSTATVDVGLSLPVASFSGSATGVDQVLFAGNYGAVGVPVLVSDDSAGGWNLVGLAPSTSGTAYVFYTQLFSGSTVVPQTQFVLPVQLTNLNCTIDQAAMLTGSCGFSFGALREFTLNTGTGGGEPLDWVHSFHVQVVPEPATLTLLGFGLAGVALVRGWHRVSRAGLLATTGPERRPP